MCLYFDRYISSVTVEDVDRQLTVNAPCGSWLTAANPDKTFNISDKSRTFCSHLLRYIHLLHMVKF